MKAPSLNGTKTPPATQDASRKLPKGPSVSSGAVRSSTAVAAGTIGPRTA